MNKHKLRFRDAFNKWYTWVIPLVMTLINVEIYAEERAYSITDYFLSIGDNIGYQCAVEFPGAFGYIGPYTFLGIFLSNLIIVLLVIWCIYLVINRKR